MTNTPQPAARRPRGPGRRGTTMAAMALFCAAAALVAGCDSTSDENPAAPDSSGTESAGDPGCPDAATLFALTPDQPTGVRLTDTTCSGTWAFIGVTGPGPAQDVRLFEHVGGTWRPVDEAEACAAGDSLPADLARSVCDAG